MLREIFRAPYEKITIDGEKWIVSPECADKLSYLGKKITHHEKIKGSEICGADATGPTGIVYRYFLHRL